MRVKVERGNGFRVTPDKLVACTASPMDGMEMGRGLGLHLGQCGAVLFQVVHGRFAVEHGDDGAVGELCGA